MATATVATASVAVAAATVNKIIKVSRLSLRINSVTTRSINFASNRQFINRQPATPTPAIFPAGNRFSCFCTAANANINAEETVTESTSEGPSVIDAVKMLDIRVGKIIKAWRHEEADSLYVEEVDVGESEPRIICSGLVNYVPLDYLQDRKVVVLANLKARNMRGVRSNGMLMAASDGSHENVELLEPPADSVPGERIWFGSELDNENQPDPASPSQVQKKKIWEAVQPHLKTDDSCKAKIGEHFMRSSAGVVVCRSLKNANIS